MTQQCGICGAFLPKPESGDRWRICGRCQTTHEVERDSPLTDEEQQACLWALDASLNLDRPAPEMAALMVTARRKLNAR